MHSLWFGLVPFLSLLCFDRIDAERSFFLASFVHSGSGIEIRVRQCDDAICNRLMKRIDEICITIVTTIKLTIVQTAKVPIILTIRTSLTTL